MNERSYRLGLVSISFRKNTPREILEAVKAAGLSCIEWGSDVHAPANDTARLCEIAEMQKAFGIECSSYGTYFKLGVTPMEELPSYIDAAKILGTDIIRLWCGAKNGGDATEEEVQSLVAQCREAAKLAEQRGVTLCMECHYNTHTQRLADALALMREIDSPHFRMYWQPFQKETVEDNLIYAETIAPYAKHIHVFQWKGNARFPLADGTAEWREYLLKFDTPRTLLLEFMPDDRIETLPTEADALRAIVANYDGDN